MYKKARPRTEAGFFVHARQVAFMDCVCRAEDRCAGSVLDTVQSLHMCFAKSKLERV